MASDFSVTWQFFSKKTIVVVFITNQTPCHYITTCVTDRIPNIISKDQLVRQFFSKRTIFFVGDQTPHPRGGGWSCRHFDIRQCGSRRQNVAPHWKGFSCLCAARILSTVSNDNRNIIMNRSTVRFCSRSWEGGPILRNIFTRLSFLSTTDSNLVRAAVAVCD
jgi:hypothetical protein